jgi:acyl-CoA synthetase (AMP-forming)/AMP-acid ligase II
MSHSIEDDLPYETRTLPALWRLRVASGADAPCLWFPDRPQESWSSLDRRVGSVAARLRSNAPTVGDRVCLLMQNSPEMIVVFLALWRLGLVAVPLSPQLSGALLEERFSSIDPALVVVDAPLVDQLPAGWGTALSVFWSTISTSRGAARSSLKPRWMRIFPAPRCDRPIRH